MSKQHIGRGIAALGLATGSSNALASIVGAVSVPSLGPWGLGILIGGLGTALGIQYWRARRRQK